MLAFSWIFTVVYGYPIEEASEIAVRETKAFLDVHPEMEVIFCCFSEKDKNIYEKLLKAN